MASMLRAILLIYVLAVSTGAAGQLTPMYQLYHPGSTDHFYTIDLDTRIRARDFYGFTDQGVAFFCRAYECNGYPATKTVLQGRAGNGSLLHDR